jgi:hypothetical protein
MISPLVDTKRWGLRRQRADELKERWGFAAEVLAFYAALLDVQEAAYVAAVEDSPKRENLAAYAVRRVLPRVIDVSVANGPPAMTDSVLGSFHDENVEDVIEAWLRGDALSPVERYLARASVSPLFEACGAALGEPGPRNSRQCPTCGGLPQLSYFASSPEDLVTAHRYLECSRCATTWAFARMTCASCGETETSKLSIFGEIGTTQSEISGKVVKAPFTPAAAQFPHLRIDGCKTCNHYVINVDLDRDGKAVPVVDEIAAIPLSLYAAERGMSKIVPNLMGF